MAEETMKDDEKEDISLSENELDNILSEADISQIDIDSQEIGSSLKVALEETNISSSYDIPEDIDEISLKKKDNISTNLDTNPQPNKESNFLIDETLDDLSLDDIDDPSLTNIHLDESSEKPPSSSTTSKDVKESSLNDTDDPSLYDFDPNITSSTKKSSPSEKTEASKTPTNTSNTNLQDASLDDTDDPSLYDFNPNMPFSKDNETSLEDQAPKDPSTINGPSTDQADKNQVEKSVIQSNEEDETISLSPNEMGSILENVDQSKTIDLNEIIKNTTTSPIDNASNNKTDKDFDGGLTQGDIENAPIIDSERETVKNTTTNPIDNASTNKTDKDFDGGLTQGDIENAPIIDSERNSLIKKDSSNQALSLPISEEELYELFSFLDEILSYLPEDKIQEFAHSSYYDKYIALLNKLGI